jgi:hypothetical protein
MFLVRYKIVVSISLVFVAAFIFITQGNRILYAEDLGSLFYSHSDSPKGMSYGNLMQKYWDWWVNVPKEPPISKSSCYMKDIGNVVFLVDPLQLADTVNYTCKLPEGKALFFPLQTAESDHGVSSEYAKYTDDELIKSAKQENEGDTYTLMIDGKMIPRDYLKKLGMVSPFWNISISQEGNQYDAKTGNFRAVTDGVFVFLKPLSPGSHEIQYSAASTDISEENPTATRSTEGKITYKILVNSTT